jgi:hypothetical protein
MVVPGSAVPESVNVDVVLQLLSAGDVMTGGAGWGAVTVKFREAGVGSTLLDRSTARTRKV